MSKSECASHKKLARRQRRATSPTLCATMSTSDTTCLTPPISKARNNNKSMAAMDDDAASSPLFSRSIHAGVRDLSWDFRLLRAALKNGAQFLQDSGYRSSFTTSTISNENEDTIETTSVLAPIAGTQPRTKTQKNRAKRKNGAKAGGAVSRASKSVKNARDAEMPLYGTGWMIAEALSDDSSSETDAATLAQPRTQPNARGNNKAATIEKKRRYADGKNKECDGWMCVSSEKVKIARMSEILASEFAFLSGLKARDGRPILTFPDSHSQLSFDDYQLLISYLFINLQPQENTVENGATNNYGSACKTSTVSADESGGGATVALSWNQSQYAHYGSSEEEYVVVIDRRNDKWSTVRLLFSYITAYFPVRVGVVFVLKPEGVLQRALEVGYRNVAEYAENFRVVFCQSLVELTQQVGANSLTMDVGGTVNYVHAEWVQHRMDIERMKSSATVIAESLSEFGKCLRETELPNDVETTEKILELQTAERDAIKEDFRISIRKGVALLRQIRQFEQKPNAVEQLSPSRLHNVEAIERMLLQLEDTERSFDAFWTRHHRRLTTCLSIRCFEDSFRKLQASFAKHMLYLEEHRDAGHSVESAERLSTEHRDYAATAIEDVSAARTLRADGDALLAETEASIGDAANGANAAQFAASCDSLTAKRGELARMADALENALERRARVLALSKKMHACISEANNWCRCGVDLLSSSVLFTSSHFMSLPTSSISATDENQTKRMTRQLLGRLDEFLVAGEKLQLDSLKQETSDNLILLTTTETSSLLAQVAERIDDIRRLAIAHRNTLKEERQQLANSQRLQKQQSLIANHSMPNLCHKGNNATIIETQFNDQISHGNTNSTNAQSLSTPEAENTTSVIPPRAALRSRFAKKPVQVVSPEKKIDVSQNESIFDDRLKMKSIETKEKQDEPLYNNSTYNNNNEIQKHLNAASPIISTSTTPALSLSSSIDSEPQMVAHNEADADRHGIMGSVSTPIHAIPSTSSENGASVKFNYILEELLNTEESYVKELESVVEFYVRPFEAIENSTLIPANLRGQSDIIFGNLKDLAEFHRRFVLAELQQSCGSVTEICRVLINHRNNFLALYRPYCQNKPQSETLRGSTENNNQASFNGGGEQCKFFKECQRRAGHLLPLGSYLLKPIQRITKYQLLLKELLRCCAEEHRREVEAALTAMLELLGQLNADMQQLHILGFAGDLRLFGPLRLQTECEVYAFKRKSRRLANKPQKRHVFLFDGGVLFCKKRTQTNLQYASEYYEHKLCIPIHNLGFAECSKWSPDRFELWDESRNDGYAVKIADDDEKVRAKWIVRLARLTTLFAQQQRCQQQQQQQAKATARSGGGGCYDAATTGGALHQRRHSSYISHSASSGGSHGNTSNTAHQQWLYQQQQLLQQQQHHYQRPQSWTSDGSCSMSSRSSFSAFDDGVTIPENFTTSESKGTTSPTAPSNSVFARRRLSSMINSASFPSTPLTHKILCTDGENNISDSFDFSPNKRHFATEIFDKSDHMTNIQIPTSKSFQNATEKFDTSDTLASELYGKYTPALQQSSKSSQAGHTGQIIESARRRHSKAPTGTKKLTSSGLSTTESHSTIINNNNNNNKTEVAAK